MYSLEHSCYDVRLHVNLNSQILTSDQLKYGMTDKNIIPRVFGEQSQLMSLGFGDGILKCYPQSTVLGRSS